VKRPETEGLEFRFEFRMIQSSGFRNSEISGSGFGSSRFRISGVRNFRDFRFRISVQDSSSEFRFRVQIQSLEFRLELGLELGWSLK
jgi:hypothetical protein